MARWVRRRDRAGRVLVIANQKPGVLAKYGLTREQVDRTAWAVDRAGRRWEGAAAINRVMEELGGFPSTLAAAYRATAIAAVEDWLYGWFAPRRSRFRRFGIRPECEDAGSGCE
jgi:predicted DCC family thiol-disulfide oxidoreductase YuxK